MSDGVRGDQGLETTGVDVIDKGDLLVLQVDGQHIIEYIEAGWAVTGQFDDNLLLF